jgi:hypothetical protein
MAEAALTDTDKMIAPLPGEGEVQHIRRTRVRIECDECGETATEKHTYVLPNARRNPASAAHGRDDCTWCEDERRYTCGDCKRPRVDGYEWCSTFKATPRMAHLFLRWKESRIEG